MYKLFMTEREVWIANTIWSAIEYPKMSTSVKQYWIWPLSIALVLTNRWWMRIKSKPNQIKLHNYNLVGSGSSKPQFSTRLCKSCVLNNAPEPLFLSWVLASSHQEDVAANHQTNHKWTLQNFWQKRGFAPHGAPFPYVQIAADCNLVAWQKMPFKKYDLWSATLICVPSNTAGETW